MAFSLLLCLSVGIFLMAFPLFPKESAKNSRLNFLLITIDTLRTDRLSCYNGKFLKTPNIDRFAEKGILFSRAFAHSSTTLPSHTNILLGVTPLYHGVHENANFIVREEFLSLAEHLKNSGYLTAAIIGGYPLHSRFGLAQGFDTYDDDYEAVSYQKLAFGERKAEIVVSKALEWLKDRKPPWFLWIHCYDPHDPYEPPEPFKARFEKSLYDGEVAYVDFALEKLFSFLEETHLFQSTMIVFTGDHGESLGQHGELTHGYFAYNTAIWIPLIVYIPGVASKTIHQFATHIDIFPTICDLLNLKKPSFLQGISLLPAIKGKKLPERSFYFESLYPYFSRGWAPLKGYVLGSAKFIDSPLPELYDLEKDFDELHNLVEGKKLDNYRKHLDQVLKDQSPPERINARGQLDRESLEKLRSLGYISSPQLSEKEIFGPEDDVKTLLPYHNKSEEALDLYQKGKTNEGIELLKEVLTERKNIDIAYTNLATLYKEEGRLEDALEILRLGLENLPSNYGIILTYAKYLNEAGRYDKAIEILNKQTLRPMEYDPEIWNYLGFAYAGKEDFEKALTAYEKALSLDKEYAVVYNNLGNIYISIFLKTNDPKKCLESIQNFKKAIQLEPDFVSAYSGLGTAYRHCGNLNGAIQSWEKALEFKPDDNDALFNLGLAYLSKGDKEKALDYFNKFKEKYYHLLTPANREKLDALIEKCKQNS